MCQISSLMVAAEGPVAEFSSFANLEEKKRKSNLLMSFPKTANQMGSFGQIRKNSFFRFCRPILDIFGLTLLRTSMTREIKKKQEHANRPKFQPHLSAAHLLSYLVKTSSLFPHNMKRQLYCCLKPA